MNDNRVAIAFISKCWGVKGDVIAKPLTDFPARFQGLKRVWVSNQRLNLEMEIENVREHGNRILIKFKEIDNRDEANRLRDSYVEIDKSEVYELPPGHYYVYDLIGLEVIETTQGNIGYVDDVWEYPASDIIVVRSEKGRLLLPNISNVVLKIDLETRRMEVKLLPGLEFEAE